ncbi:hypothetical protein BpHYR1_024424 [Brachionus plicatilis]|uniref:Uncharacterized protein n=1 Tax=Brachionus plicatilis TaxID=10195 RepID=A0A3M7QI39_BRAPC|nr:hypothetical protein BpHYR1_024424 [Brachionus plicatilis]
MEQRFEELNQNVVFLFEVLNYTEELFGKKLVDTTSFDSDYLTIQKMLALNIQSCFNLDHFANRRVKLDIFSYLLKGFFDFQTIVPAFKISQHLLIDLMVDAQFEDLQDVIQYKRTEKTWEIKSNYDLHKNFYQYLLHQDQLKELFSKSGYINRPHRKKLINKFKQILRKITDKEKEESALQNDSKVATQKILILSCLNKQRMDKFNKNLLIFLNEKASSGQFDLKFINFSIDWLLSEFNCQIYKLIHSNLNLKIDLFYLTKILDKIIDSFECVHKKDLQHFLKSEPFKRFLSVLDLITHNFTNLPEKTKINNLKKVLNFLSFVTHQMSIEPQQPVNEFLNYLVMIIKKNYGLEFDEFFAIRHKLYGYEKYLKDFTQNLFLDKTKNLTQSDLEILKLASNELADLDLIFMIYQLREIKIQKDTVLCLQDENFDKEFTVSLNQVSATSDQDEQQIE